MNGGMFIIRDDEELVELNEKDYDSEELLQKLLAKYPKLLAGDQIDSDDPRRWLLISREISLPSDEGGSGRWYVDHLLVDQDGIPTLVEVKRSSDTRIRREVIGQMLDYASNAVVHWPVETILSQFQAQCQINNLNHDEVLSNFLDTDSDEEEFWQKIKTNLQAGKIRLIFVADQIPSELKRVVEFLNAQMDPAEVLAIELKQYVGKGTKTLVPRVFGNTIEAQQKKSGARGIKRQWDENTFFQELESTRGIDEAQVAKELLNWAESKELRIWWGRGKKLGSFFPVLDINDLHFLTFSVWTTGPVEIQFQFMKDKPPFDNESKRVVLLEQLNKISGVNISRDGIIRRPPIQLSVLTGKTNLKQFLETFDWYIREIKNNI